MTKTKKFKAPFVGRVAKRQRGWWSAYVPAIGVFVQATSVDDAASALKQSIEMRNKCDGEQAVVTVTVVKPAVKGVAYVALTCDRPGLLEARAAEFARLSAGMKGASRNPFFVAVRRGGITVPKVVDPKFLAKPTNMQRIEQMRESIAVVASATGRPRRGLTARVLRDLTIHRLGMIGEAASATTKSFRAKHPSVPWADVIALRESDRLLDQPALRKAATAIVPALAKVLARPEFEVDHVRLKITRAETKTLHEWAAKNPTLKPKKRSMRSAATRQGRQFKAPLAGRITKLRRARWTAHVPAIGAFTQGRSLLDAAQMLKRVIEMMLRLHGHKVIVTVTVLEAAVNGVAAIAVTCDRPGVLEVQAVEFARLSAGVKGPITNPFFVAVRRDGITLVNNVEPKLVAKPTNKQRLEHMREHLALIVDAACRAGRAPAAMRRDVMIYRLGVMGVAAAATTKAFRAKHSSIPWAEVIAMQELLGKPDRLLDHTALRKIMRETVPALMKALARPDLAEVIQNITPAAAWAVRAWAAKNLLPKPNRRSVRSALTRQGRQGRQKGQP